MRKRGAMGSVLFAAAALAAAPAGAQTNDPSLTQQQLAQPLRHPLQDAPQRVVGARRHRVLDELPLAAVALRWHHHPPRDRLAPRSLVHQRLEQRLDELAPTDPFEEPLDDRHCRLVPVGERELEPGEQHFVVALT